MRLMQIGSMEPMSGVSVVIQLPEPCIWRDMHISTNQTFKSDETGLVEMWLPPNDEMRTARGGKAPDYLLSCQVLGRPWSFRVPSQREWMIVPR